MATDEFAIPSYVAEKLKSIGYEIPGSMTSYIEQWHSWYTCTDSFYKVSYISAINKSKKERRRYSLSPARKVCREWASLLLNEDTEISVDNETANKWLGEYLAKIGFWLMGQKTIEKAFALGTAAWALWFNVESGAVTDIKLRRYDARMVVPISWDEEEASECAFVTRVTIKGKTYTQLQVHAIADDSNYHIQTSLFDKNGKEMDAEANGILDDFDTEQTCKTFGIVKPGLDNVVADLSPYGISVFYDALDAIKATDLAWDAIFQEVDLARIRVFLDESLIDVKNEDGKPMPVADLDDMVYRMVEGQGELIKEFAPNLRIEPMKEALNIALSQLGDNCGFGEQYFQIGKNGGLKTATEVVSDNSVLMRNVRKHENSVGGAIKDVITGLLSCAKAKGYGNLPEDPGAVNIKFDDSIIVDTQTEKNLMLSEIAAGVVPKWKYLMEFYGMSEEQAKAALPDEEVLDIGF